MLGGRGTPLLLETLIMFRRKKKERKKHKMLTLYRANLM